MIPFFDCYTIQGSKKANSLDFCRVAGHPEEIYIKVRAGLHPDLPPQNIFGLAPKAINNF